MLEERPSCTCPCTEISRRIDRNGANGPVRPGLCASGGPTLTFKRSDKFGGIAQRHPALDRKLLRASSHEKAVLTFFEDSASQAYRVSDALHGAGCAGLKSGSVHQDRVELRVAIPIKMRASSCIEDRIVLEFDDGFFAGIHRWSTGLKDRPASDERAFHAVASGLLDFLSKSSSTTVNDQS